ncbi:hypothetical protein J6TS1_27750 [Siminovitchia terrae]|uniref:PH domain-containing protein n=1 Tax=Siminovitchia terrae TaxID=1914933 RepID=A0ABQ4KY52_SIMTE|nr:hypothetical protein [Siminovitchia terrae]GIN96905.1 hypothetical protein J6TS1_27750 [Siminovitchia terrae]
MTDDIRKYNLDNIDNEKEFTQWVRSLKSIKSTNLHALILEYDQVERERKQYEKYSYIEELPFHLQFEEKQKVNEDYQDKTILDIHVSPLKRKVAYTFVNRLLKGIELLGGQVYTEHEGDYYTELRLPYVSWKVTLLETKVRGDTIGAMQPVYRKKYSGTIQLELINLENKKKLIYTDELESLLNQLETIFLDLRKEYLLIRDKKREERRKSEAEQELIRARHETEKLAKEQEKLKAQIDENRNVQKEEIFDHIEYLEKIKKVERYLHTLQSIPCDDEESKKILQDYVEKVQSLYNLNKFTNIIELWNSKFD